MRDHQWLPKSSDFTEWECEFCGHYVESVGPPCRNLQITYTLDELEHEITCEEIEAGAISVFEVHDA